MSIAEAFARTSSELRVAVSEARRAWSRRATAVVVGFVVVATAPLALPGALSAERLAEPAYLALAGIGLAWAVRGGMPSVGQGLFVGIGAITAAHLRASLEAPFLVAALGGTGAALLVGIGFGAAVARLRPAFVAVGTFLAASGFALALLSVPDLAGGANGLVVPEASFAGIRLTPSRHYELALALSAMCALGFVALARSPVGLELAAIAHRPEAARTLGVAATRQRVEAFAIAAAVGGLAGSLSVQLAGIADPTAYGPFLSFELLVAVLIGGATSALGAPAGIAVLTGLAVTADGIGVLDSLPPGRFERALDAGLLLLVLSLGGAGLVPWIGARTARVLPRRAPGRVAAHVEAPSADRPTLTATGLGKHFDGVRAVDDVDLALHGGRIYGLIGPNGSGKTTVLRLLSGAVDADDGAIELDQRDIAPLAVGARVAAGLVRTSQESAPFSRLTVLEHVLLGASLRSEDRGAARALFRTPRYRAASCAVEARAWASLGAAGLAEVADVEAGALRGAEQRLLAVATAVAAGPRVLLLDEPSAGAGPGDLERLAEVLERVRDRGVAILLVEHNVPFVRAVADEVGVLVDGALVATGAPDDVLRDQSVRRSYFGVGAKARG